MRKAANSFYRLTLADRRRLLADTGFVRDGHGIWSHPDGRALGEGVAAALTDASLLRYLKVDLPPVPKSGGKRKSKSRKPGR